MCDKGDLGNATICLFWPNNFECSSTLTRTNSDIFISMWCQTLPQLDHILNVLLILYISSSLKLSPLWLVDILVSGSFPNILHPLYQFFSIRVWNMVLFFTLSWFISVLHAVMEILWDWLLRGDASVLVSECIYFKAMCMYVCTFWNVAHWYI